MDVRTMLKTLDSLYAQGNLKEADNLLNRELEEALVSGHDAAVLTIYNDMEERMKTSLGTKVSIQSKTPEKGRIEIEYFSSDELDRIYNAILGGDQQ